MVTKQIIGEKMNLSVDFPLILTVLVIISGLVALFDMLFLRKKRKLVKKKQPKLIEYAREFFPVLLIVLLIRSFLVQPYHVPTGSLEPTILPGDFIAVNQFAYGLRLPVLNTKVLDVGEPKRGDIALFRYPKNPAKIYIKRVIGVPGDHIVYRHKILMINGKIIPKHSVGMALDVEPGSLPIPVYKKIENLFGIKHKIYQWQQGGFLGSVDVVVPKGHYFMMGDNRDNSGDSRVWGFVPEKNLVGKAYIIWMSWDSENNSVRWHRIGKVIK
ncbi:MAG: signal peptidase I [Gammaproteobacteria bacterium]|nr:signal peptidase I [Gammaproteobacteria bacterium]